MKHPTGGRPKTAILVALGPTRSDYIKITTPHEPPIDFLHEQVEVWTVNTGIRAFKHDLAFVMDDLSWYAQRFPKYGEILKNHDRPIITNTVYPEFPSAVEYPLGEIIEACDVGSAFSAHCSYADYFRNSIPYILAYAYLIGIKHLLLYGVDFDFPGARREHGRANVEYWIGFLNAKGVRVDINPNSPLCDTDIRVKGEVPWFYGYLRPPIIDVQRKPKEEKEAESGTVKEFCLWEKSRDSIGYYAPGCDSNGRLFGEHLIKSGECPNCNRLIECVDYIKPAGADPDDLSDAGDIDQKKPCYE